MLEIIVFTAFPGLLIAAAISDVASFRIPNWLVGAIATLFFPCAIASSFSLELTGSHILAGATVLAFGFLLFIPGYIGGGDAKLLAAAAMWLGFDPLIYFVFWTALFGGMLALLLISFRRIPLPITVASIGWVDRLHTPDGPAPYGVAISAAALSAFSHSVWISQLA